MDSIYRRKYCKYKSKYKALKINSEQTGGGDFKLVMKMMPIIIYIIKAQLIIQIWILLIYQVINQKMQYLII